MKMKIAIKEVGKDLVIEECNEKYRTDTVRRYIGKECTTEYVFLTDDGTLFMGVDEDGLSKELETNFYILTKNPYFPIQKIVGTVVFGRVVPPKPYTEIWDYEMTDLTDNDLNIINRLLDDNLQNKLKKDFQRIGDYGKGFPVFVPLD